MMDGVQLPNQGQRTDWTRTNPASEEATQQQQPQPTRRTGPGSIMERLGGQPAHGASRNASFRAPDDAAIPYDQLDSVSQQLSGYGFSQAQMDDMGTHEVLCEVAEVWPSIRLSSPISDTRALVIGVAKAEGVAGLQALLEMTRQANSTRLLAQKAEAIRGTHTEG